VVWQKAHALVLGVYAMTPCFPKEELFGLTSQIRRAAVSVPGNFAEGYKRRTPSDKARFFNIAQGSLEECRYYLILARDLKYADIVGLLELLDEVARMLAAYSATVTKRG
jgi:four helix bundle protein